MTSFQSLIFTRPGTLNAADRGILRRFFEPYRPFFVGRGINLDTLSDPKDDAALSTLAQTFLSPGEDTPRGLIDAVFCVSELATANAAEALQETCQQVGIDLSEKVVPAEAAMLLYLADPAAAKRLHCERIPLRARSFEYFGAESGDTVFEPPSAEQVRAIERSLDIWFRKRRMGTGCRIFTFCRNHETWFLIRRGDLYCRKATVADDGRSDSVLFRPERFDVLVYDGLTNEIRINAKTPVLRDRYRTTFSLELFGQENYFPETNKYTLDPIRRDGSACVECVDIPGLKWIRLAKLEYVLEDLEKEVRSHKAEDVFNAIASRQFRIPTHARLLRATFKVRFQDNPTPRSVTIKPSNVALYTRDDDCQLVEEWLMRRGFIEREMVAGHEQRELFLEMS